jgi:hypothetical protein
MNHKKPRKSPQLPTTSYIYGSLYRIWILRTILDSLYTHFFSAEYPSKIGHPRELIYRLLMNNYHQSPRFLSGSKTRRESPPSTSYCKEGTPPPPLITGVARPATLLSKATLSLDIALSCQTH